MIQIVIIGGGIGGLVAGIALQKAGFAPKIYERASTFGEVGAGLSISPNATLGLESLGLADFLAANANEPLDQMLFHGITGEPLISLNRRTTRETYGAAYYQLHRADLHKELVRRFGIENCVMDCHLIDIRNNTLRFANHPDVTADVVIAADGLRSVIRDTLFDPAPPVFSGHVAWRALVPADQLGPEFVQSRSTNHVCGRNLVTYPVRQTALVNIVALTRSDHWAEESWSARADKAELLAEFEGWDSYVAGALAAIPCDAIHRWGLFVREPLNTWIKQRTALLGDAAHPMLPYMGQGASCAIEDGVVLGRCFAATADVDEALMLYENARIKRASMLQAESNLGGDRLQKLDPYMLRDQPLRNEDSLGIFAYDPANVPL
jgi:salicylate hydroxylase